MILADIMKASDCLVDLRYATKAACLGDLVRRAAKGLGLDAVGILDAIQHREALGSTGLGKGIAIPHARIAKIRLPFVLLACLREPIAFDAIDDQPVDLVCLVLLPASQADHQAVLSCIARRLREPATIDGLRRAKSAESAFEAFAAPRRGDGLAG